MIKTEREERIPGGRDGQNNDAARLHSDGDDRRYRDGRRRAPWSEPVRRRPASGSARSRGRLGKRRISGREQRPRGPGWDEAVRPPPARPSDCSSTPRRGGPGRGATPTPTSLWPSFSLLSKPGLKGSNTSSILPRDTGSAVPSPRNTGRRSVRSRDARGTISGRTSRATRPSKRQKSSRSSSIATSSSTCRSSSTMSAWACPAASRT